jgi:phage shock protein PspC (stress-responsive transcriptional regulator)
MTINANQTDYSSLTRLRRSVNGQTFGGVAAGLATFFGLDVTHVRMAFIVLALLGGAGLPLYLAGWAFIPAEGSDTAIVDGLLHPTASRSS